MTALPDINLPPQISEDDLIASLDRVLDPELDESVLSLGFVASVASDDAGNVTVFLRLPTYWCAANFSYLMASDVQRALEGLEGICSVTVNLGDHFAGNEVEHGVGAALTFGEAFPDGGPDTIEATRQVFLLKGYFRRQERLLRSLKDTGMSYEEISALKVGDLGSESIQEQLASRYLERRKELGLDCSGSTTLIVDTTGRAIPPEEMQTYYIRARTTRLAMEASGSLCSAMLQSRNSNWTHP